MCEVIFWIVAIALGIGVGFCVVAPQLMIAQQCNMLSEIGKYGEKRMNDKITDEELKKMWDLWDGTEKTVYGYRGEDLHAELNRRGLGAYCAV